MKPSLKNVYFILFLLLRAKQVFAQGSKDYHLHGYLSLRLEENYIGIRPSRLVHDDWMLWGELFLELPKGFFVDIWQSVGLDDNELSSNAGDEIEVTAGLTKKMFNLDISLSCTLFNLHPLREWSNNNLLSEDIKISKKYFF